MLSLAAMIPITVGPPTRQNVRHYAVIVPVVGFVVTAILFGLSWLVLAAMAVAIVLGLASRRIPVTYVSQFLKYAAPGLIGILGLFLLSILALSGLSLLAVVLAPLLVAVILIWFRRNVRELYRQAPD
jgi:hypothetical protein